MDDLRARIKQLQDKCAHDWTEWTHPPHGFFGFCTRNRMCPKCRKYESEMAEPCPELGGFAEWKYDGPIRSK